MKRYCTVLSLLALVILLPGYAKAQAPANDSCGGAVAISSLPFHYTQDTRLTTVGTGDPVGSCNDTTGSGKTVWFTFTADSTRNIKFSTASSTPADYDIVLTLYTGTCGNLVEVSCNDDINPGTIRQSEINYVVQNGVIYTLMVGEWNGGGPNGGVPTGGDLVLDVSVAPAPTISKGPRPGSSGNGVVLSTDNFTNEPIQDPFDPTANQKIIVQNNLEAPPIDVDPRKLPPPLAPEGSNLYLDKSVQNIEAGTGRPVIVKSFSGIPQTNSIPPDPIMAVGPNHVLACVNTTFRIWDKSGTVLKTITAASWHSSIAPNSGPNDPQIVYDHYGHRWIMQWMTSPTTTEHFHMLSISDDDNPLGTWYVWKTPAITVGDSATPYWGDYPALGFDSVAIYLVSRQFPLAGGGFQYSKLRIFNKAELYGNTTGAPINWKDVWDFRDPANPNTAPDGVRPMVAFSYTDKAFLMNDSPFRPGTYFTLWTISDPLTNPTISVTNIPVVAYQSASNANQLGGSTTLIEAGGSRIRSDLIYRDSTLWAVHSIGNGAYSALRYVKINPFTKKNLEDISFGASGFWYYYPTIMVDKDQNLVLGFSRSGLTEYPGAYFAGRRSTDAPGLSSSVTLAAGQGNYVQTFGGTRNRWGDYNGSGLDPTDGNVIWGFIEYAANKNTWGTYVGKVKVGPLAGAIATFDKFSLDFGTKNVGTTSDTLSVTLTNDGTDTLTVSNISSLGQNFTSTDALTTPIKIPSLGTLKLSFAFTPKTGGPLSDSAVVSTDDPNNPQTIIRLRGFGFIIVKATAGTIYSTSGTTDGGKLYSITSWNGAPTLIGPTGLTQVTSLRVHPTTKELIGLDPSSTSSGALIRLSAAGNINQVISNVPVVNLKGMSFLNDTTLYIGAFNGNIFRVGLNKGDTAKVAATGLRIGGLAVNPTSKELWISLRSTSDAIYKVNLPAGTASLVGNTGFAVGTVDIVFDKNGKLYGLTGTGTQLNSLIVIDTATAKGNLIGSTGKSGLQTIAFDPSEVTGVQELASNRVPTEFALEQNYPNPFNPATAIRYNVPVRSLVRVMVFDILGRAVTTLVNGVHDPGSYRIDFDASRFASGVYYYKLSAGSYSDVKRMILVK